MNNQAHAFVSRWAMRIKDFECVVSHDGNSRAAASQDNGNACYIHGQGLVAHGGVTTAVLRWLLRPLLREAWEAGWYAAVRGVGVDENPYTGEPPNKDNDPS